MHEEGRVSRAIEPTLSTLEPAPGDTSDRRGLSRRRLLARAAVGAGAVWVAPVVAGFASRAAASSDPPDPTVQPQVQDRDAPGPPNNWTKGDPSNGGNDGAPGGSGPDAVDPGTTGEGSPATEPLLRRIVVVCKQPHEEACAIAFAWDGKAERWRSAAPGRRDFEVLGNSRFGSWHRCRGALACSGTQRSCTVVVRPNGDELPAHRWRLERAYVVLDSASVEALVAPTVAAKLSSHGTRARFDSVTLY